MSASAVKLRVQEDGVGIISIHNPPKNTLNNNVMSGLQLRFEEAHSRRDVRAIVLTATGTNFSFGVDLTLFQHIQQRGCENDVKFVPAISFMSMIEDGPKPAVAALQGYVIGAGLEMTLACHARVADLTARFSVPDFHNGIIPGLGGTQRLPRLVGVKKALDILWMERPLTAVEAMEAGLIDDVAASVDVLKKACMLALDISERRSSWKKSLERIDRLEKCGEALHILRQARFQSQRDHPNLLHPLLCMDVMEEGILKGGLAGAILEEKFSHGLVNTPIAKGLMHVFFARRFVAKVPASDSKKLQPSNLKDVAVIGCGITGADIATAFLLSKIPTKLKARHKDDLHMGLTLIEENIKSLKTKGKISERQAKSMAAILTGTTENGDLISIDLVVEASEGSTQHQYEALQELAKKSAHSNRVVASSSSLTDLGALSTFPHLQDRIIGMHFVSPAYLSELVEISYTEKTSPQALVDAFALVKHMRKLPLPVKSSPGLVVDHLCNAYYTGISLLGEFGVQRRQIYDSLKGFGMAEVVLSSKVGGNIEDTQSPSDFVHSHNNGKKTLPPAEEDIVEMVLFPVVSEAYRILNAGIVGTAEHIDIASILGMGFPTYRGGIVFWGRAVGLDFVASQLAKWGNLYGSFFRLCPQLSEALQKNQAKVNGSDQLIARL